MSAPLLKQVERGVSLLREGRVVAYPTDTLYGLGADFACLPAVQRVLEIKGRPQEMGMPLLLSDFSQLPIVAEGLSAAALLLAERFWPGALTLVVRRSARVPNMVTGGRDTVAVRAPAHPVPIALASGLGRPITGTSANNTGQPPATTAQEVVRQLDKRVDLVIDGGPLPIGLASTIVDATGEPLKVLRLGAISLEALRAAYPGHIEG